MESLLNRGEKLDDLVAKSDELNLQSKTFYTQVIEGAFSWCKREVFGKTRTDDL